jgi:hypothetical protein
VSLLMRLLGLGGKADPANDPIAKEPSDGVESAPGDALPPPDADGPYQYFLRDGHIPVRVLLDSHGFKREAHAPDHLNNNELALRSMTVVHTHDSVEDISKRQFVEVCRLYRCNLTPKQFQEAFDLVCPVGESGHVIMS